MTVTEDFRAADGWFVVATSADVPPGQIVQSFLHGQELALWRDTHGAVQVWENRCPHRGTRFTIGRIVDDQLACAYHGWRFAADGHCTHIPAHPDLTPPRPICAKTYAVRERYGMIWASLGSPEEDVPALPAFTDGAGRPLFCRSFVTRCPADEAARQLLAQTERRYRAIAPLALAGDTDADATPVLLIQPMNEQRSIWHLWLVTHGDPGNDAAPRERHVTLLKTQRGRVEAVAAALAQQVRSPVPA